MTRIQTTVVGSYPIPDWLPALHSQQALKDATATFFHTQELAGIDLVADSERVTVRAGAGERAAPCGTPRYTGRSARRGVS
jgi:hypothetical protein